MSSKTHRLIQTVPKSLERIYISLNQIALFRGVVNNNKVKYIYNQPYYKAIFILVEDRLDYTNCSVFHGFIYSRVHFNLFFNYQYQLIFDKCISIELDF